MKQITNEWPFYNSHLTLLEALDKLIENKHTIQKVIPIEFSRKTADNAGIYSSQQMDYVSKAIIISIMP